MLRRVEHTFVDSFRLAAIQAGAVARHLQGKVRPERKHGDNDESEAVTAVDLATQDVILHALLAAIPDVAIDAEEDTPVVRRFPRERPGAPLVVVDPIDGTLNYIRGSKDYAVMGALISGGLYRAAVVYFPAHERMCWAVRGEGTYVADTGEGGGPVERIRAPALGLVTPWTRHGEADALASLGLEVSVSRCSAVDSSAPAIGRARAAISHDRADRRRAIPFLLTTEAGGAVRLGSHRWDGEDPKSFPESAAPTIVAASGALADDIARAIAPR